MPTQLRGALRKVIGDPRLLKLLRNDPKALASELKLSAADAKALASADVLINTIHNPLDGTTTTNPITITITKVGHISNSGDPAIKLTDLSKERLIQVLERTLVDQHYAGSLRSFLRLKQRA
ncbi:MAG: hypothetical protein E6G97_17560 [Alphaproteobacteria bacterium]|nr:MAG: hypothetical protein E6G97_17560 [Alphaproteobacteria bacterium]